MVVYEQVNLEMNMKILSTKQRNGMVFDMYDNESFEMKRLMRKMGGSYRNILENVIFEYRDERYNDIVTMYDKNLIHLWKVMFYENRNCVNIKQLFEAFGHDRNIDIEQYLSKREKYKQMVFEALKVSFF